MRDQNSFNFNCFCCANVNYSWEYRAFDITVPKYPSFCLHKVHIRSFCFAHGNLTVTFQSRWSRLQVWEQNNHGRDHSYHKASSRQLRAWSRNKEWSRVWSLLSQLITPGRKRDHVKESDHGCDHSYHGLITPAWRRDHAKESDHGCDHGRDLWSRCDHEFFLLGCEQELPLINWVWGPHCKLWTEFFPVEFNIVKQEVRGL